MDAAKKSFISASFREQKTGANMIKEGGKRETRIWFGGGNLEIYSELRLDSYKKALLVHPYDVGENASTMCTSFILPVTC